MIMERPRPGPFLWSLPARSHPRQPIALVPSMMLLTRPLTPRRPNSSVRKARARSLRRLGHRPGARRDRRDRKNMVRKTPRAAETARTSESFRSRTHARVDKRLRDAAAMVTEGSSPIPRIGTSDRGVPLGTYACMTAGPSRSSQTPIPTWHRTSPPMQPHCGPPGAGSATKANSMCPHGERPAPVVSFERIDRDPEIGNLFETWWVYDDGP